MTEFTLQAEARNGNANKARQEGKVPGVIYGKNFDPISFMVPKIEFDRIFKEAGTSNLIDLNVNGQKVKVLIHDFQKDPVKNTIVHVDFLKVNMKEKIHAEIPIEFFGDSPAVMDMEGSLITPVDSIEVECLPADLPSEIKVDISILDDFEKNIKVEDLKLPQGVEILSDAEEILAFVQAPRSEEELADLEKKPEEDVSAIEVEHAGEETAAEGEAGEGSAPAEEKKEE